MGTSKAILFSVDDLDESGFSLLSLVFLILVLSFTGIAVLSAILPSALTRQTRDTVDKAAVLRAGVSAYAFHHGGVNGTHIPNLDVLMATDGGVCALDTFATSPTYLTLQGWCGPYADPLFSQNPNDFKLDGWGTVFTYDSITARLTSCGPNRTCGDADDIIFN